MSDLLTPLGAPPHQSKLTPQENKFHAGNGDDGKHYWLTPPDLYGRLDAEFGFTFDPCPHPLPDGFDGLTCEWGSSNWLNPPFGSIIHQGKKKGPTAWVRKAIAEWQKGKQVVLVYPMDKWVLMLLRAILGEHGQVRNLGDVRWLAIEDGSEGKGTGRHIACFILRAAEWTHRSPKPEGAQMTKEPSEAAMHGLDYEPEPSEAAMREAAIFLRIACLGTDVCAEYNKRCVCALRLARLIELQAAAQREKDAKIAEDWVELFGNHKPTAVDAQTWANGAAKDIAAAIRSEK